MSKASGPKLVVEAIRSGTVIDHIPGSRTLLAVELLTSNEDELLVGVNLPSPSLGKKGILKIREKHLDDEQQKILAVIAPTATVNVISEYEIVKKIPLKEPAEVRWLFVCPNENCVTNNESVETLFTKSETGYVCHYCERGFRVDRLKIRRTPLPAR